MPKKRDHGLGALYYIPSRDLWRGVVDLGERPDGTREQKYVHARKRSECARRLEKLKAEIAEHGAPLSKSVRLADWAVRWLEEVAKPGVDPKTYQAYTTNVHRWIVPTIGRRRVADISPSDVRSLRTVMTKAGRSTSTISLVYITLSLILDAAVAERLCRTNVAREVRKSARRPRGATVANKRSAFSTDQAVAVLRAAAAMPNAAGSRWWFKLLVGQRQGEILGARIDDLDLDAGLYTVNWKLEDLRRQHGCGDNPCGYKQGARCPDARWVVPDDFEMIHLTGAWHLTRPKSNTGRVTPLIPQLVEAIRRHLDATADQPNPHGLIWRHEDGSPITPAEDAQEWRDLLVTAGVITPEQAVPGGTDLTGHVARHTTVTILASLGVDFQIIGEIVGHSSTQVTAMYRHAQETEKRAAMSALGGAWAEAIGPAPEM